MALRAFRSNPSLGGFGGESRPPMAAAVIPDAGGDDASAVAFPSRRGATAEVAPRSTPDSASPASDCDAFAQIVKELADNAVDACCGGSSSSSASVFPTAEEGPSELKRVRVVMETDAGVGHFDGGDVLRVTVSDNGVGMNDIQSCVEAFRTSKAAASSSDGNEGKQSRRRGSDPRVEEEADDGEDGDRRDSSRNERRREKRAESSRETAAGGGGRDDLTAGRYGIGLTLCLLHAQRLVPNSCASITSAMASAVRWTRASYVVDTDGDAVRCVKKELLPKRREGESGTAVSLLVPGGEAARQAWPRLAEYFARFQLSLGLECSLQVMAPSLSSVPLFVRPPIEMERRTLAALLEKRRRERSDIPVTKIGNGQEGNGVGRDSIGSSRDDGEDLDWNDGMLDEENDCCNSPDGDGECSAQSNRRKKDLTGRPDDNENDNSDTQSDVGKEASRQTNRDACLNSNGTEKPNREASSVVPQNGKDANEERRRQILRSATAYLNRPGAVELSNVAHSIQPVRRRPANTPSSRGDRLGDEGTRDGPMLEVDMVVFGPDDEERDDDDGSPDGESEREDGDEFERMFSRRRTASERNDPIVSAAAADGTTKSAKLMLVRMVNRVPLLDGAEAAACGLVRGISANRSTWNSFGLDVSASSSAEDPSSMRNDSPGGGVGAAASGGTRSTEAEQLHMPTFDVRDSVQVAPFFQSSTHSLFEFDRDGDDDDENEKDDVGRESDEDDVRGLRKARKRKAPRLLPAGLRLGNVLVIAQIHATPSALPLPTLSKGRLPMNDKSINDALEIGLRTCLRSLQKTNPNLLLTSQQLKRTERDSRYVPAVAAALSTIVCNSKSRELRSEVSDMVLSWNVDPAPVDRPLDADVDERSEAASLDGTDLNRHGLSPDASFSEPRPDTTGNPSENIGNKHSQSTSRLESQTVPSILSVNRLGPLLENRLRFVLSEQNQSTTKESPDCSTQNKESKRPEKKKRISNDADGSNTQDDRTEETVDSGDDEDSVDLNDLLHGNDSSGDEVNSNASQDVSESRSQKEEESEASQPSRDLSSEKSSFGCDSSIDTSHHSNLNGNDSVSGRKLNSDEDDFDDDEWW